MNKEQKQALKARVRARLQEDRDESARIRALSKEERQAEKLARKVARKTEKENIKQLPKAEKKLEKKFLKKVARAKRRPYVLTVWAVIVLTPLLLLLSQYLKATAPVSDEIAAARAAAEKVAAEVQAEGSVLLRNTDQVLPLKNTKVNIFGTQALAANFGGGGSGSINSKDAVNFYQAMSESGFELNPELTNLYYNWQYNEEISTKTFTGDIRDKSLFETLLPNIIGILGSESYNELVIDDVPETVLANAKAYSDTAIYMIGSYSRETAQTTGFSDKTRDSLILNDDSRDYIEYLNGHYENVILLVNTGNQMELGWIEEFKNVKGVMWIGYPGAVGFYGVADLLSGEQTPSGRLADTIPYNLLSAPATQLVGNFAYENLENEFFINFNEGIYIGYRYYETYFADDEAGYQETVQFPFGYGLSYTSFDWQTADFRADEETISIDINVTNVGDYVGKEIVQVYYSAPYTPGSGLEKSVINLAAYDKTRALKPGESETITIEFPVRSMASYDEYNNQAWLLEAGDYQIKIARNVHDVVDTQVVNIAADRVYRTDEVTGHEITNLFEDARGDLQYVTRDDFDASISAMTEIDYTAPASVIERLQYNVTSAEGTEPTMGADNGLMLSDLVGLSYDDPKWQAFLDQFTFDEMVEMVSAGGWQAIGIERLGIPKTLHYDGPASLRHYFGKWSTVGFPSAMVVSQSWNDELQEKMAEAMTYEAKLRGIHIWYAPAMNLHRTAQGARNFEYFSEDPLLSGKAAAALSRGAHNNGLGVTVKHFALYNQETNRNQQPFSWVNEQALREIYFKPFEISIKESGAYGVMSSFPRIGHDWAGESSALLKDLLRDEWGFRGFVVSDITIGQHMKASEAIKNGNDLMLFLTSGSHEENIKLAYETDPVGIANALRYSVHNISYAVAKTHAMDGLQ